GAALRPEPPRPRLPLHHAAVALPLRGGARGPARGGARPVRGGAVGRRQGRGAPDASALRSGPRPSRPGVAEDDRLDRAPALSPRPRGLDRPRAGAILSPVPGG